MVGFKELLLVLTAARRRRDHQPARLPAVLQGHRRTWAGGSSRCRCWRTSAFDVDGLDRAFGAGAKALLLCSPHNPSGRVHAGTSWPRWRRSPRRTVRWVVVDEIHAPLTFGADVHAVAARVRGRRGAHLGLEGVQPAGAEARVRGRSTPSGAARRAALPRGLRGRDRGGGGVHRRRRVAGRDDRDDRRQPARAPALLPDGRDRRACRRRRPTWRGWSAPTSTIPRAVSSSAGAWRCRPGARSAPRAPRYAAAERRARGPSWCARRSGAGWRRRRELRAEDSSTISLPSSITSTTWRVASARYAWLLGLTRAVEPGHLGVGEREEVVALRVEEVGQARAEALLRQLQRGLDLVTRRLDADALVAELHDAQYGRRDAASVGLPTHMLDIDAILRPWWDCIQAIHGPLRPLRRPHPHRAERP